MLLRMVSKERRLETLSASYFFRMDLRPWLRSCARGERKAEWLIIFWFSIFSAKNPKLRATSWKMPFGES